MASAAVLVDLVGAARRGAGWGGEGLHVDRHTHKALDRRTPEVRQHVREAQVSPSFSVPRVRLSRVSSVSSSNSSGSRAWRCPAGGGDPLCCIAAGVSPEATRHCYLVMAHMEEADYLHILL